MAGDVLHVYVAAPADGARAAEPPEHGRVALGGAQRAVTLILAKRPRSDGNSIHTLLLLLPRLHPARSVVDATPGSRPAAARDIAAAAAPVARPGDDVTPALAPLPSGRAPPSDLAGELWLRWLGAPGERH